MFEIRNITPSDIENLNSFIDKEKINIEHLHKYLDNFLICKWEGVLCGFAFGLIKDNSFFIKNVYIKSDCRKKGLGSTLIKAFINKCDAQKINNLFAYDDKYGFYKELGFEQMTYKSFSENENTLLNIYGPVLRDNLYFLNTLGYTFSNCC